MGAKDATKSIGDVLNSVRGVDDGTDDAVGTTEFLKTGGRYTTSPTAAVSGDARVYFVDPYGYNKPSQINVLVGSFTTAAAGTSGTAFSGARAFEDVDFLFHVTAASGTSPTLDFLVDSQLDGTNWANIAHITQITAAGTFFAHLTKRQASGEGTITSDAGAGTFRAVGWADNLRVRYTIAGTSPSFSARVWLNGIG